ncbi:Hypothetical predicted protein [Podarcis lilfordi]|nr:Hypothetical predicted protein [Podarcis lilfordi]
MTYWAALNLLSTLLPNYKCNIQKHLMAVIGGLDLDTSVYLANILGIYKIPQLHPFLRTVSFNNSAGETVSFGENREVEAGFDITNMVTFPNNSFVRVKVGRVDVEATPDQPFTLDDNRMVWHRSFHQEGEEGGGAILLLWLCSMSSRQDFVPEG